MIGSLTILDILKDKAILIAFSNLRIVKYLRKLISNLSLFLIC